MANNNDSQQASLDSEVEKAQPQKESSVKTNLKYGCLLIVFLGLVVYLMNSLKEIQDKYDQLARKINDGLEQTAKENKECIARALQAEYEIKSNSAYATEAMTLAEKALTENEYELAKVYSLNAINHMPYEIKYIETYFQLFEKQSPTADELKRFTDILDMSAFQIAPSDILRIIAIKKAVMQKLETLNLEETNKSNAEFQIAFAQKVDSLENGELSLANIVKSNVDIDLDLLSVRCESIKAILEEGVLDEQENEKWKSELARTNIMLQLAVTLHSVVNATYKAEAMTSKASPSKVELVTAQNQLQTANAFLAQIWTIDCSAAPELLKKAEAYQAKIAEIDAEIKKKGSRPAYDEIKKLVSDNKREYEDPYSPYISYASYTPNKWYTNIINRILNNVDKIKEKLNDVSDETMQKEILDDLKTTGKNVQELSKNRYNVYQKWALEKLTNCHNAYNSEKLVSDDDAAQLFRDYLLAINPALLAPDLSSLYNSIYQRVYNKLGNADKKANFQIKKASQECMSLEDF